MHDFFFIFFFLETALLIYVLKSVFTIFLSLIMDAVFITFLVKEFLTKIEWLRESRILGWLQ